MNEIILTDKERLVATEAEEFATVFYNIGDRSRFIWKASQRFGHHSTQYRIALAAWDEIQEDMEVAYD